jgi:SHS2 domain-containing protein
MYEWRSHTAEIELAIEADSEEQVFIDALAAFSELVALGDSGAAAQHDVALEAADRASLLVEWLQELIFLADTESFIAERADELHLEATSITATLLGRHAPFEPLVKAATYHGLRFEREGNTWRARVVLDV